jgi:predicted glycoside hydrolase/deacetylase ChbG (UPF0249 family)
MNELFINADDFGLHPDINRGILDCVAAGNIGGISVCPIGSAPDWARLREVQSAGIDIGIHITLMGEPWCTVDLLIPDWLGLVGRLAVGGRRLNRQIETEVVRQIEICLEQGLLLGHLDSHQHAHLLPGLWPLCLRLAQKYNIRRIRVPAAPCWGLIRRSASGAMLHMLALCRRRQTREVLPCIGLAHSGKYTMERIEAELRQSGGSDIELIVHPGITTEGLSSRYAAWHYDWSQERNVLTNREFLDRVAHQGYRLAR